jgi:hypothetical protein
MIRQFFARLFARPDLPESPAPRPTPHPHAREIQQAAVQAVLDYGLHLTAPAAARGLIDVGHAVLGEGQPLDTAISAMRQQALRCRASLGPPVRPVATNSHIQRIPRRRRPYWWWWLSSISRSRYGDPYSRDPRFWSIWHG